MLLNNFPSLLYLCRTILCKKSHSIITLHDSQCFFRKIYNQRYFGSFETYPSLERFIGYFQGS